MLKMSVVFLALRGYMFRIFNINAFNPSAVSAERVFEKE